MTALVVGPWIESAGGVELYDVHEDPHELRDLASRYPAKVEELRTLLRAKQDLPRPVFAE